MGEGSRSPSRGGGKLPSRFVYVSLLWFSISVVAFLSSEFFLFSSFGLKGTWVLPRAAAAKLYPKIWMVL